MTNLEIIFGLEKINTSSVTNMSDMFHNCRKLTGLDLSGFNTANVTNMNSMFFNCSSLASLNIDGFNTSNVTDMAHMFQNCRELASLDVRKLNTSNVTNMLAMFSGCESLTTMDLSLFRTNKVTDMSSMFNGCSSLKYFISITGINTSNVKYFDSMFKDCISLTDLNLLSFAMSSTATSTNMLNGCKSLQSLTISSSVASYLNASACQGVGTTSAPCSLNYASDIHPTFTTIRANYQVWNAGYFKSNNMKGYTYKSKTGTMLYFTYDDYYRSRNSDTTIDVYDLNSGSSYPAWHSVNTAITSVYFNSSFSNARPTTTYGWFDGMSNLTTISYIGNLDTSEVTNMQYMFWGCSKLASISVSMFSTAKVTTMRSMFSGCSNLTTLTGLANLNTSKVTDFSYMFNNCVKLTSLDISKFTFSSTTSSAKMFYGCTGLKTLSVPSTANYLNADACTNVGTATNPCELEYPNGFTPEKTEIYDYDNYYVWKDGYFRDLLRPYAVLNGTTLTFYYDKLHKSRTGTVYELPWGYNDEPLWLAKSPTITSVVFNSSFKDARPTSCHSWFKNMSKITGITGLSYLNTSEVEDMAFMFEDCTGLRSLDLSSFTSDVYYCYRMFAGCTALTSLDLSNMTINGHTEYMFVGCSNLVNLDLGKNRSSIGGIEAMFSGCSKLKRIDISHFDILEFPAYAHPEEDYARVFKNCSSLESLSINATAQYLYDDCCIGVGTASKPCILEYPDGFTPEKTEIGNGYYVWKGGYFCDLLRPYAVLNGTTLTFYYDKLSQSRTGTVYEFTYTVDRDGRRWPSWYSINPTVTRVVFNSSFAAARPTECTNWFYDMRNLTTFTGFNYFNTSEVSSMSNMFAGCSSLKVLNLSSFNTSKVTDMSVMFGDCTALTNLNVSSFNTANVNDMRAMFGGCSSLTSLNLSHFNTAKVESMEDMFKDCKKLNSFDLSHFDTSNVWILSGMFDGCSSLTSLDVSNFNTANVDKYEYMFHNCTSLKHLDISNFSFKEPHFHGTGYDYIDAFGLFEGCSALESLTVPASIKNCNFDEEVLCTGVGTASKPCILIYPEGFTPRKSSTGDGYYVWSGGYFCDKPAFAMGDVNHDGAVSVADVMLTVSYVMGNRPDVFYAEQADMNGDNDVSVADVISIVTLSIGQPQASAPRQARTSHVDRVSIAANGSRGALLLDNCEPFTAMQFTIVVPEGAEVGNVRMDVRRANGHQAKVCRVAPGRYNVMLYAMNGAPLRDGTPALLTFDYTGCQPEDIAIEDAQLVNAYFETVLPEYAGLATGIAELEADSSDDQPYYNTVGVATKSPHRGVYIRNGQKVVVK